MKLDMQHWDNIVSPTLSGVERRAKWLTHYSREIEFAVRLMPVKPAFKTNAEHELGIAHSALTEALARVEAAQNAFKEIPEEETV